MFRLPPWGCAALLVGAAWSQPVQLRIYSEFQRVDPFGRILAADRAERPREILSPAVARNAFASFHVAVTVAGGAPFWLFFGQNPEGVFKLTVYRERFVRMGGQWWPDPLERIETPFDSRTIVSDELAPGQTTHVFWLDVWTPDEAPVRRVRLEAQLNVGDHWVIAPLEVRIRPARVPSHAEFYDRLPEVTESADRAALGPLLGWLCGGPRPRQAPSAPPSIRSMIRRNAWQDRALAQQLEARLGREAALEKIFSALGAADWAAWCQDPQPAAGLGAEWVLRVRDALLRLLE